MFTIFKKELKNYFLSPIGYIYIGIFLLACSLFFYIEVFANNSTQFASMFSSASIVLTFIVPILTMRMFAEERKDGTEQLLLTSPKSVTEIVLGKFFAACVVVLISTFLTFIYYIILASVGKPQFGASLISILGFSLLAISYVAFGMFASTLTQNQIVAAIISMGFFVAMWLLPSMNTVFLAYSPMYAFQGSFIAGMVSLYNLSFLITFTIMFIVFTIMRIQRRKLVK